MSRLDSPSRFLVTCYITFVSVGWYFAGLGAILPELENDVGSLATSYAAFPGVILVVWGIAVVHRHRGPDPRFPHALVIRTASVALAVALLAMGFTTLRFVSVLGALGAAAAVAVLVRLLPAAVATARPVDTERVLTRATAWSSLAGIASPLAIGATIGVGAGWLPGMFVPIAVGVVAILVLVGRPRAAPMRRSEPKPMPYAVPSLGTWWREWLVLTLSIVLEFCFTFFAATYLHEEVGLSTAWAATGTAAFAIGMTAGRFWLSAREPAQHLTLRSLAVVTAGFLLVWGLPQAVPAIIGIGIAGLGMAALYPTGITALLGRFPASPDQAAARGSIASGTAVLAAPVIIGALRAATDVRIAFLAVPALVVMLAVLLAGGNGDRGRAVVNVASTTARRYS